MCLGVVVVWWVAWFDPTGTLAEWRPASTAIVLALLAVVVVSSVLRAGTGFEYYRHVRIPADEPPPPPAPPQPTDEDLDLDREIEYAFDADEPMAGRAPSGDVE